MDQKDLSFTWIEDTMTMMIRWRIFSAFYFQQHPPRHCLTTNATTTATTATTTITSSGLILRLRSIFRRKITISTASRNHDISVFETPRRLHLLCGAGSRPEVASDREKQFYTGQSCLSRDFERKESKRIWRVWK